MTPGTGPATSSERTVDQDQTHPDSSPSSVGPGDEEGNEGTT